MKTWLFSALLISAAATLGAQSDYSFLRVGQSADQLKRATVRLAERAMQDLLRSAGNTRADVEDALLAQQMDASATVLVEMVRNRRPGRELRDVAVELAELSRRAPSYGMHAAFWRPVQAAVTEINRDLSGTAPGMPARPGRPVVGRVTWRGVVDDRVQLVIQGRSIETRTLSGAPKPAGVANFTTPLPTSAVDVDVTKLAGRGTVTVLQQPSRTNDFTAVIEIHDSASGAQEYRLDIFWR